MKVPDGPTDAWWNSLTDDERGALATSCTGNPLTMTADVAAILERDGVILYRHSPTEPLPMPREIVEFVEQRLNKDSTWVWESDDSL